MVLFIGWNAWSVLEYLMTGENIEDTYWKFKADYYKDYVPTWISSPFKLYNGEKVDRVYVPSALTDADKDFLINLGVSDIRYLEEGEYDYIKYKDEHMFKPFYTLNPDRIANKEVYSEIRQLYLTDDVIKKYLELYDVWEPSDDYDVILYTDPLDKDLGIDNVKELVEAYMNENHSGSKILVKAHPRDTINWCWDMCSHRIPAQMLLMRDVIHIFMYNTTVIRYLGEDKKKEMINITKGV